MSKRKLIIGLAAGGAVLCLCGLVMDAFGPGEAPPPKPTATSTIAMTPTPSDTPTPTATTRPKPSPTAKPTPPTKVYEWRGVEVGTPTDDVLEMWGKPLSSRKVGEDFKGAIVEWVYEDVVLTSVIWELDGIECYRVWEMRLR